MFTGIIQHLGKVEKVSRRPRGMRLVVTAAQTARVGESISVNGVCLTVVSAKRRLLAFDVVEETLKRTNLGELEIGARVNLERALKVGDELGGHFVQGHIDGVGHILKKEAVGDGAILRVRSPSKLSPFMVEKGAIAVDGVGLTLVDVCPTQFSVALIPHTLKYTTLGFKSVGAPVNLEVDILAKYIQKQQRARQNRPELSLNFLQQAGFAEST